MILSININIKELSVLGKSFKWQKPSHCPRCKNSKLWGHGFVNFYFDGYKNSLILKRYRCFSCHCIITMKPTGFWNKYQTSIEKIYKTLKFRLEKHCWPPWTTRQKAGHWIKAFTINVRMLKFRRFIGKKLDEILTLCFEKEINFLSSE